jgi:diguanylate cyclase (GGDEF)-like protein
VPVDPIERFRECERGHAHEDLAQSSYLRATRHALLTIYTPQQAAIWLGAHESGDPVSVARKARRLCGIDDRTDVPPTPDPAAEESARITRELERLDDPTALLHRVVDLGCATIGAAIHVGLSVAEDGPAGLPGWVGPPHVLGQLTETIGEGPARDVRHGSVVESLDLNAETRWPRFTRQALASTDVRSLMIVPVCADEAPIGALHVYAAVPEAFTDRDRTVATLLAVHAGAAMDAIRSGVEVHHLTDEEARSERAKGLVMARQHTDERSAHDLIRTERHESAPDPELSEVQVHEILIAAIRDIFTSEQPEEIQAVLLETVHRLGGTVARAREADELALPIDLSLGVGETLLATPSPDVPDGAEQLRIQLPRLVEDARHAIDRLERHGRLAADAEHDVLTGLLNRRAYERLAGRLRAGDVLVLIDLDDFKTVNDDHGHIAGDQVLRVFGSVLRDQMRITEHAVRLGGDEFLIVLEEPGEDGSEHLLERLQVAWRRRRPLPVDFSAGVAEVTGRVDAAMEQADRALYAHKYARAADAGGRRDNR